MREGACFWSGDLLLVATGSAFGGSIYAEREGLPFVLIIYAFMHVLFITIIFCGIVESYYLH